MAVETPGSAGSLPISVLHLENLETRIVPSTRATPDTYDYIVLKRGAENPDGGGNPGVGGFTPDIGPPSRESRNPHCTVYSCHPRHLRLHRFKAWSRKPGWRWKPRGRRVHSRYRSSISRISKPALYRLLVPPPTLTTTSF